jgi:hypothetical protein
MVYSFLSIFHVIKTTGRKMSKGNQTNTVLFPNVKKEGREDKKERKRKEREEGREE